MPRTRKLVYYSGRVQGVGFRATACHLAREHAVGGFVRNLADGRVELVAEGEANAVETFLTALERAMGPRVRDVQAVAEPPSDGPDPDFVVRYD
jgi:acylphosphatase